MARSVWKGPFFDDYLLKKVQAMRESGKLRPIKTWSRRSVIIPQFNGFTFDVHNGKKFISVFVSEDMIGRKLGEFSLTRTFKGHSGSKKVAKK
jgi:small subunit ribosomal protein S19